MLNYQNISNTSNLINISSYTPPVALGDTRWTTQKTTTPVTPAVQGIFKQIQELTPSDKTMANVTASAWATSKAVALFNAIYQSGITSQDDIEKIDCLEKEIAVLDSSADKLSPQDKKSLKLAHQILGELVQLRSALEKSYPLQDEVDDHVGKLNDATFVSLPGFEGEVLVVAGDVIAGAEALMRLIELRDKETTPGSSAKERLSAFIDDEIRAYGFSVNHWGDKVADVFSDEMKTLLKEYDKPDANKEELSKQLNALHDQHKLVLAQLAKAQRVIENTNIEGIKSVWFDIEGMREKLENAGKQLAREITHRSINPAHNIKYGGDEWRDLAAKRPRKQPWKETLLGSFLSPDTWSPTTKAVVGNLFGLMQLSQQAIAFSNQISQAHNLKDKADFLQKQALQAQGQNAQEQQRIAREGGLIGTILSDKYEALVKDPSLADKLSRGVPEISNALKEAVAIFGEHRPGREEVSKFQETYELKHSLSHATSPYAHVTVSQWWDLFTTSEQEAPVTSSEPVADPATALSTFVSKAQNMMGSVGLYFSSPGKVEERSAFVVDKGVEAQGNLQEALTNLQSMEEKLTDDFSLAKNQLKSEILLLQEELIKTSSNTPKGQCPLVELAMWRQEVSDKCYAVAELERRINHLMAPAKAMLSLDDHELEKYGKKHANIVRMARLVESLDLPGVVVPLPRGLSNDVVSAYLKTHAPQIFDEWNALAADYENYTGTERFLDTPEVKEHLESIAKGIREAFAHAATNETLFEQLATPEFAAWLHNVKANQDYLMVRSTGSEDSRETANAGGNVSRAYVPATPQDFCNAAADVVISYFGFSSLQNRINAGLNPFAQELKLAVTAQQLIGEPVGGAKRAAEIPVSLVMFTNEPLYIGGEKFRVMRISGTYGHGEGVVGGVGIASDTALLLISEAHPDKIYVQYTNQEKPTRLAPVQTDEGVKLVPLENKPTAIKRQALDQNLLTRLYTLGVVIEKYFDDTPTDMEIVVKNDIIYPVQARPVNRRTNLPTYVDTRKAAAMKLTPLTSSIHTDVLVPGRASVIEITSPNEIVVANRLEEAQKLYDPKRHKLVIVKEPEPANSHPVVNFSGLGVTCLKATDISTIEAAQREAAPETPLVIDSQTGTVHTWDASKGTPADFVVPGYAVHPAIIALSLLDITEVSSLRATSQVPQEVKRLLAEVRSATTDEAAKKALQELRATPFVSKLEEQRKTLSEHTGVHINVAAASSVLDTLASEVEKTFDEVQAILANPVPPEEKRLRTLLPIKTLETLVADTTADTGMVARYSCLTADPVYEDALEIVSYQQKFSHPVHFADIYLAGNQAVNPASASLWKRYLESLEPQVVAGTITPSSVKALNEMIITLEKTGMLPTWFAFNFNEKAAKRPPNALVEATLPPRDKVKIDNILSYGKEIAEMKKMIPLFSDAKSFKVAWDRLQVIAKRFAVKTGPNSVGDLYRGASPITRQILLSTMNEMVDLFDVSVKAMKMTPSEQLPDDQKAALFKEMVVMNYLLLQSWATQLKNSITLPSHTDWNLESYINRMDITLWGLGTTAAALLPTRGFSVAHSIFGAATAFERGLPGSLEDFFTLTHQNLVAITSNLYNAALKTDTKAKSMLPPQFADTLMSVKPQSFSRTLQRVGMEIGPEEITVRYNIPLRNHAARMTLKYDRQHGKTTLVGSLVGEARDRWGQLASVALLKDRMNQFHLATPVKLGDMELEIEWECSQGSINDILAEFDAMCTYSLQLGTFDNYVSNNILQSVDYNVMLNALADMLKNPNASEKTAAILLIKTLALKSNEINSLIDFVISDSQNSDRNIKLNTLSGLTELVLIHYVNKNTIEVAAKTINDPYANVREKGVLLFKALIENELALFEARIERRPVYDKAVEAADKSLIDPSANVRENGLQLFIALVKKGQAYDKAAAAADKSITDPDVNVREMGVQLFHTLIQKGQAYDKAAAAAGKSITNPDAKVRNTGLQLYKALVIQEQVFGDAADAAGKLMADSEANVRWSAKDLYIRLFDMKQAFDHAVEVAGKLISHPNAFVRVKALELLEGVVDRGLAYDHAVEAACKLIADPSAYVRLSALVLFDMLFSYGQAYDQAAETAGQLITDPNAYVRENALELFKRLIKKGQAYEQTTEAAGKLIADRDLDVKRSAWELLSNLVQKGQAYDQAAEAAGQLMDDSDVTLRWKGVVLYIQLVQNGKAYDQAAKAAGKLINDPDADVRQNALSLFIELVNKGQAYDQAAEAAGQLLNDSEVSIRWWARELYTTLFQKGQAYDHAVDAARMTIEKAVDAHHILDVLTLLDVLALIEVLAKEGKVIEKTIEALEIVAQSRIDKPRLEANRILGNIKYKIGFMEWLVWVIDQNFGKSA